MRYPAPSLADGFYFSTTFTWEGFNQGCLELAYVFGFIRVPKPHLFHQLKRPDHGYADDGNTA